MGSETANMHKPVASKQQMQEFIGRIMYYRSYSANLLTASKNGGDFRKIVDKGGNLQISKEQMEKDLLFVKENKLQKILVTAYLDSQSEFESKMIDAMKWKN